MMLFLASLTKTYGSTDGWVCVKRERERGRRRRWAKQCTVCGFTLMKEKWKAINKWKIIMCWSVSMLWSRTQINQNMWKHCKMSKYFVFIMKLLQVRGQVSIGDSSMSNAAQDTTMWPHDLKCFFNASWCIHICIYSRPPSIESPQTDVNTRSEQSRWPLHQSKVNGFLLVLKQFLIIPCTPDIGIFIMCYQVIWYIHIMIYCRGRVWDNTR